MKRSSPEPPPPPPPATRPGAGSPTAAAATDLDYETVPDETAARHPDNLHTDQRNVHVTAATATPAPPLQTYPDYEYVPVDAPMPSAGTASTSATPYRPPTLEYAVPLTGGKSPAGSQRNSNFAERPTDGGSETSHVAVGDEAEYALPYRASVAEPARRSIPDVARVAMGVDTAEPG